MVILLKTVLGLLCIFSGFIIRFIFNDYKNIIKSEGFENSSLWQRFVLSTILYSSILSISFLSLFFIYIIISPMQIGSLL